MKKKQSKKLDYDRLEFATELLRQLWIEKSKLDSPIPFISDLLNIMQFGDLSMQDVLDYIQATGQE